MCFSNEIEWYTTKMDCFTLLKYLYVTFVLFVIVLVQDTMVQYGTYFNWNSCHELYNETFPDPRKSKNHSISGLKKKKSGDISFSFCIGKRVYRNGTVPVPVTCISSYMFFPISVDRSPEDLRTVSVISILHSEFKPLFPYEK